MRIFHLKREEYPQQSDYEEIERLKEEVRNAFFSCRVIAMQILGFVHKSVEASAQGNV